jgi:hypothetical protein
MGFFPNLVRQYNNNNNSECTITFQHMQGNRVQLDKKHWYESVQKSVETAQGGEGNHTVESTSTNRQNHPH